MATPNASNPNKKVVLDPNVPQQIALRFPTGKEVTSQYKEEKEIYYSLVDGRGLYVSMGVAQSINMLRLEHQEPFFIALRWNGERTQPKRIDVWLTTEGEKRRAGIATQPPLAAPAPSESELEDQLRRSLDAIEQRKREAARKPPAAAPAAEAEAPVLPWVGNLVNLTNGLTAAYAATLAHASEEYGNTVKPEDVRQLLTTAFIALSKNGVPSHG